LISKNKKTTTGFIGVIQYIEIVGGSDIHQGT
jgi:hypothetical protein